MMGELRRVGESLDHPIPHRSHRLYDRRRELAGEAVRHVPSDSATRVLLWARAILEYNGEQWYCVHPLVRELLEVMKRE